MGGDISDGAKIGIGLVLLVAIVAIVMQLLKMVKSQANSGSTALQDSFQKVAESEFDGYDQVEKTGTDVKAAVKIFEGRPVAIIVQTKQNNAAEGYNYGCLLAGGTMEAPAAGRTLAKVTVTKTAASPDAFADDTITKASSFNGYTANLHADYTANTDTTPMSKTSTDSYVRDSARFMSYLIKDANSENVGIYFEQTK